MRPNSPDVLLLMLGSLEKAGKAPSHLPDELVEDLFLCPEDLEE